MYAANGTDVLDFKINFKVTRMVRKGLIGLRSTTDELVILNDVKGRIESGTMTALLGASGCGKSTLLAALSQRLRGKLASEIHFKGEAVGRSEMTNISGFVPQSDVCIEGLTVQEHFHFMKRRLIETSLIKFGLDGNTNLKYLSGGEKRKLSLASELLTKPQILFCDEPTSGLDSFSALAVMNTLRELAGYVSEPKLFQKPSTPSRIILFSIHQPTSDIFHLFTNIILMNAGRIIFHGTVQEAQTLFTSIERPCPQRYNPAEFYVNQISDPKVANDIVKQVRANEKFIDSGIQKFQSSESSDDTANQTKVSWLRQVFLLSHRSTLNFLHDPKHYLIELLILVIFAFIITLVYSGVSFDSDSSVQDVKGFLIILATEVLFTFVYSVFYLFYEVLPILRKETGDRLYSLSAYYVSLVGLLIPRVFFETFLYTAIIYFSTDIGRDFTTYLKISFSIAMASNCAISYGFFLSGLFDSILIGTELSSILDLILMLVSGIYINVKTVPLLKYISFFFYANETVAISFWLTIDEIKCSDNPEFACFPNGTAVLESLAFGTSESVVYEDYLYQLGVTLVLHVLAFIGIRRLVRKSAFY